MKSKNSSESGQIIVLLAIVLLGLLGFTALAVDGGMVYSDRRFIQSAADASSMAGAGAVASDIEAQGYKWYNLDCKNLDINDAYSVAINKAATNDFTISQDPNLGTEGHTNGVKITCDDEQGYVDVMVMLTRDTQTSLVQLFTDKPMTNLLASTTRVYAGITAGNGNTIVSLSKNCKPNADGIWISGSNKTYIFKGGLWSNSCISRKGAAEVTIEEGKVTYYKDSWVEGITDPVPDPSDSYHPLTGKEMIPNLGAQCWADSYDDLKYTSGEGKTISPGNYRDWDFNVPVKLEPGLYCVSGTISMNSSGYVYMEKQTGSPAAGVTIYYTGTSLTLNGGSDTQLAAPNGYVDTTPPNRGIEDVLLYIPTWVKATVKINGGSNNDFAGTMYMPSSEVTINGTSDSTSPTSMRVSMIGYNIKINGDSNITFIYDVDRDYGWPATLEVHK